MSNSSISKKNHSEVKVFDTMQARRSPNMQIALIFSRDSKQ